MGVGYLINYVLYFFVPVLVIATMNGCKISSLAIGYCSINLVVKIIVIVVLLTSGWRHIGMCYIGGSIKSTIISSSVA